MSNIDRIMSSVCHITGENNSKNKAIFICSTHIANNKVTFTSGLKSLFISEFNQPFDIVSISDSERFTFVLACEPCHLNKGLLAAYGIEAKPLYIKHAEKFSTGQVSIAGDAARDLDAQAILPLLKRHINCDWGNCCIDDALTNDRATKDGSRILSSYTLNKKEIWIITEHDRSVTTILYPSDY